MCWPIYQRRRRVSFLHLAPTLSLPSMSVDSVQLRQVLQSFLSVDKSTREEAETKFDEWKSSSDPDSLIRSLLSILRSEQESTLREQAAVAIRRILRDFILQRAAAIWTLLALETREFVKTELLDLLEVETDESVRRRICDSISDLAAELTSKGEWFDLPERLVAFTESANPSSQAAGLQVLAVLAPQLSSIFCSDTPRVRRIIAACAKFEDGDVRHETLCFITALVQRKDRALLKLLQPGLPDLIAGFQTVLAEGADDLAKVFLFCCLKIAEGFASFYEPYFANFVQAIFALAGAPKAEDGVRQVAVEVLLAIAEDEPRMCLRAPEFVSELVRILLELLTVEDNHDWIDQDDSALNADLTRNFEIGYLKRDEWHYKIAAITAIVQTAEYLPEEGIDARLDEIVNIVKIQSSNQHHRVRFATCKLICQIARDLRPLFQKSYAKEILPVLVKLFDDPVPRVQHQAVCAFIAFAEKTEKADLMTFLEQFMERLCDRIKPDKPREMRELCVTSIGVVASIIEKQFIKYYSFVVPVMKGILVASTTKEERTLRGRALESINVVGLSVGLELFQADAPEVMQAVLHMAGAGLEADNPVKNYLQEGICRMCRTLQGEFAPYLPQLIPNILKVLTVELQPVNVKDTDVQDMTVVSGADGKYTGLKTSVIKEIDQAVNLLSTLIKELGAKFGECLEPAAQSLLPLLSFPLSDHVTRSALTAMAEVFTVARELGSNDLAARQKLSLWVGEVVERVLILDIDEPFHDDQPFIVELMVAEARGVRKCFLNAGPGVLHGQQVGAICARVFALIEKSSQRRPKIATRKHDPEYDEEDIARFMKEAAEQTLRLALLEIIAAVMSFHADLYLETEAELCRKFIEARLDPSSSPDDRALALHACGHVFLHLKDKGASLLSTFASRLVESLGDLHPGVRAAAAFGLTRAAKCPQFPAELIQKAADQIFALLSETQSPEQACLSVTNSMVGALGAIVVHRSSCLQPSTEPFFQLWWSNSPEKIDDEEGRRAYGDFVDKVVQKMLGTHGPVGVCASFYPTASANVDEGIRDFIRAEGPDEVAAAGANFYEERQESLKRICQDVWPGPLN